MPGTWLAVDDHVRGVADREDLRHARHGQVGLDHDPAGAVGRSVEPARGLRGLHAGGPDHRPRRHELVADTDAAVVAAGDRHAAANLGAEPLQRAGGIVRELRREGRQHPRPRLDQDHPRLAGVDVAELARQRLLGQLGDDAGELHAGRTAADDAEGHQRPAILGIGLALGTLEGEQQPAADRRRVLERLQARGRGLPFVVAEIGVPRAGREHQRVVGHARRRRAAAPGAATRSTPPHLAEQRRHLRAGCGTAGGSARRSPRWRAASSRPGRAAAGTGDGCADR